MEAASSRVMGPSLPQSPFIRGAFSSSKPDLLLHSIRKGLNSILYRTLISPHTTANLHLHQRDLHKYKPLISSLPGL
ncbi:ADP-ribosylation factor GTPase-activating protein AGD7-like [Iris pallida]|uniref:ADP-ribosylation factor GTPase-activating protein AGD7-like n=1 Tax=Iris pallida TaxID=29817 RepID=A0AAX6G703_IRIPA|nr:ADP-ribosylation factor GTPase-activating protein AGD7-like [Iris pallida]